MSLPFAPNLEKILKNLGTLGVEEIERNEEKIAGIEFLQIIYRVKLDGKPIGIYDVIKSGETILDLTYEGRIPGLKNHFTGKDEHILFYTVVPEIKLSSAFNKEDIRKSYSREFFNYIKSGSRLLR